MSTIGTPRITSGMNSGAKKKNVWPEKGWSVLPPTAIVAVAISRPSSSAPASPMKIRAGWTLWGRNPRQAPSVAAATTGPMLSAPMAPTPSSRSQ